MQDRDVTLFREQLRLLRRRLRREAPPVRGLSRMALSVLSAIARISDRPRPRDVAAELQMTSSNVAAALRELEAAGFVLREPDPGDARGVRLHLNDSGRAAVSQVRRERDTWLGQAIERVLDEDEQRTLARAGKLIQRLAEYEEQPAAVGRRARGAS